MKSIAFAFPLLILSAFGLSGCYTRFVSSPTPYVRQPASNRVYRRSRRYYRNGGYYNFRYQMPGYVPAYGQPYGQPYIQSYPGYSQPPVVTQTVPGYVTPPQQPAYTPPARLPRNFGPSPINTPAPQNAPAPRTRH